MKAEVLPFICKAFNLGSHFLFLSARSRRMIGYHRVLVPWKIRLAGTYW